MKHLLPLETRSAMPIETRDEPDALAAATQAIDEMRSSVDQFRTGIETRLTAELRGVTDRITALETRANRPGAGGGNNDDATAELQRRAFTGYLRGGRESLPPEETRSLIVGDDTKGGFLAPPQFVAEVIKGIVPYSPVRQAARVGNTSAGSVILPKRTGRPTANWVGETETRPETGSTYGQEEIPVNEAACYVDVSNQLLEDSAVNVEAEVASDLSEEFGRLEGIAFVNGDGNKKPLGFMLDPNVQSFPSGDAALITADSLIKIMYNLPQFYRSSGSWMMNGTTLASVRLLHDTNGRYLWQPGLAAGQPETLLGRPVIEAVDMPDVAAGTFPIVFGNFALAYRIYDRLALSIMRDPFSMATKGTVRFHARRRTGGGTVLAEAIRKLKIAAN